MADAEQLVAQQVPLPLWLVWGLDGMGHRDVGLPPPAPMLPACGAEPRWVAGLTVALCLQHAHSAGVGLCPACWPNPMRAAVYARWAAAAN